MSHEVAWAAGFLDGEGYIGLVPVSKKFKDNLPRYMLTVTVTNAHLPALTRFQGIVGVGTIHPAKKQFNQPARYLPQWMWLAAARDAEQGLRLLLPFLVVKKEQAEIGIASRQFIGRKGPVTHPSYAGNVVVLEGMREQLSGLKRTRYERRG